MSLQKRIDEDLKDAMRAKDAPRLSVLRLLKAALKNAAIEKVGAEGELNDADAVVVIRKQVKQRQDSIESFEKGDRADLAEKEKDEIAVLNKINAAHVIGLRAQDRLQAHDAEQCPRHRANAAPESQIPGP